MQAGAEKRRHFDVKLDQQVIKHVRSKTWCHILKESKNSVVMNTCWPLLEPLRTMEGRYRSRKRHHFSFFVVWVSLDERRKRQPIARKSSKSLE